MVTTVEQYLEPSCREEVPLTMSDDVLNIARTPNNISAKLASNDLVNYLVGLLSKSSVTNDNLELSDLERISCSGMVVIPNTDELSSISENHIALYSQIINKYCNNFQRVAYTTLEGASINSSGEAIDLSSLGDYYEIKNWQEVGDFLVKHSQLQDILFEAKDKIKEYFGDTKVVLTKEVDPEIADLNCLYAYIHTSIPFSEALEKVKQIEHEWYIKNMDRINGRFFIDVTCQ